MLLHKIRTRIESEKGFTLIELLVVILIIGILAAIALPAFLNQRTKGQDSDAKSNARNMVSEMESCYSDTQDYGSCLSATDLGTTGLPIVTGVPAAGQVSATSNAINSYVITAASKSKNTFLITKSLGGAPTRSCTTNNGGSTKGGCNGATW